MAKRKRVDVYCHGPIAVDHSCEVTWEDIWLRWKTRPKRRHRLFPCVMSKVDVVREMERESSFASEYQDEHTDWDWSHLPHLREIIHRLDQGERFMAFETDEDHGGYLYLADEYLTWSNANEALTWLLGRYGVRNPRLKWKRPSYVVYPA